MLEITGAAFSWQSIIGLVMTTTAFKALVDKVDQPMAAKPAVRETPKKQKARTISTKKKKENEKDTNIREEVFKDIWNGNASSSNASSSREKVSNPTNVNEAQKKEFFEWGKGKNKKSLLEQTDRGQSEVSRNHDVLEAVVTVQTSNPHRLGCLSRTVSETIKQTSEMAAIGYGLQAGGVPVQTASPMLGAFLGTLLLLRGVQALFSTSPVDPINASAQQILNEYVKVEPIIKELVELHSFDSTPLARSRVNSLFATELEDSTQKQNLVGPDKTMVTEVVREAKETQLNPTVQQDVVRTTQEAVREAEETQLNPTVQQNVEITTQPELDSSRIAEIATQTSGVTQNTVETQTMALPPSNPLVVNRIALVSIVPLLQKASEMTSNLIAPPSPESTKSQKVAAYAHKLALMTGLAYGAAQFKKYAINPVLGKVLGFLGIPIESGNNGNDNEGIPPIIIIGNNTNYNQEPGSDFLKLGYLLFQKEKKKNNDSK